MNVWDAIKAKLEKLTGYHIVSLPHKDDTIAADQIVLLIHSIERTSYQNCFAVRGDLAIKHSHMCNWHALTNLLDLQLTGAATQAVLTTYDHGFTAMSVSFALHVWQDEKRQFRVEEIEYEAD